MFIRKICRSTYGIAPNVKINGHVNSTFPYITTPLSYIVPEMLKNAFRYDDYLFKRFLIFFFFSRATVEYHRNSDNGLPDIEVTISVNEDELLLRYE